MGLTSLFRIILNKQNSFDYSELLPIFDMSLIKNDMKNKGKTYIEQKFDLLKVELKKAYINRIQLIKPARWFESLPREFDRILWDFYLSSLNEFSLKEVSEALKDLDFKSFRKKCYELNF